MSAGSAERGTGATARGATPGRRVTTLFVTGTDTEVGKTFVAAALLQSLASHDVRAVGMKPVATGAPATGGPGEDVSRLRAAGNVMAPLAAMNPFSYVPAIAPHVAAERAGRPIDLDTIARAHEDLAALADVVVVEGAGGVLAPLDAHTDMLDIAVRLRAPVLLVVGVRLGCINHALLSALAVRARGLELAGWVANRIDPAMPETDASIAAIAARLPAPLLASFAWADERCAFSVQALRALGVAP